ncbi:response regulator [Phenylobacterium sp.]|uniref:response regulator n=1 Tax=Phenylobacterium sp. TaxID=1871053 RepID=UPI003BABFE5B
MTMRIMVVEDDALIALDIVSLLEDMGHEVVAEAADACTAWEMAEEDKPDLALVDIRLAKNTDGGKLAQKLYAKLGVRSLFVSGSITEDFRRAMAAIDPIGFLGKPVTRRTLGDALAAVH